MGSLNKSEKKKNKRKSKEKKAKKLAKRAKHKNLNRRSVSCGENISDILCFEPSRRKQFIQIREKYFASLQSSIALNCLETAGMELRLNELESLALALEQKALLACMQAPIYQSAMMQVISEIEKATEQKMLYPNLGAKETATCSSSFEASQKDVTDIALPDTLPSENANLIFIPLAQEFPCVPPQVANTVLLPDKETESDVTTIPSWLQNKPMSIVLPCPVQPQNLFMNSPSPVQISKYDDQQRKDDMLNFLHILQDDGSQDSHINAFSPVSSSIPALPQDLISSTDGLKKIPSLSVEGQKKRDLEERIKAINGGNASPNTCNNRTHINMWRVERHVYMYRIIAGMACMSAQQYSRTRDRFYELFGSDSDSEHEDEFMDYDQYLQNCARMLQPSVARLLSPYYKTGQISGGSIVFKNLVRRISQSLVDLNDNPNHQELFDFVENFLDRGKTFSDVSQVWSFSFEKVDAF